VDIAFVNYLAIGGFQYALILVDRGTQYNWMFFLKTLSSDCILAVLTIFWAATCSLAQYFYCDCDAKLFETAISKYLIDNNSKIITAAAKHQLSNGLVESHWKVIVHMALAYLPEQHMKCTFWFYAIARTAQMMNAIPGKIHGRCASPFLFCPQRWSQKAHMGFPFLLMLPSS
jgi:hypothetical protein